MRTHQNSYTRSRVERAPPNKDGHLYYARLRTPVGILYKIGFTTMASVQVRLAYKGEGTERMIDKVLFFAHYKNAWGLEQELHMLLKNKAAFCGWNEKMPLFQNGQSELYCEDVLGLDCEYSYRQAQEAKDEISLAQQAMCIGDEAQVRASYRKHREEGFLNEVQKEISARRDEPIGPVQRAVGWVLRGVFHVLYKIVTLPFETGNDRRLAELRKMVQEQALISREKQ